MWLLCKKNKGGGGCCTLIILIIQMTKLSKVFTYNQCFCFIFSASVCWSNTETTILCPPSDTSFSYLIWRFNHSQSIVTRSGADISYTVYAGWEQHVKHVSESGSLTLRDLTADHEGIYTCELSDAEETKVSENEIRMMPTDGGEVP